MSEQWKPGDEALADSWDVIVVGPSLHNPTMTVVEGVDTGNVFRTPTLTLSPPAPPAPPSVDALIDGWDEPRRSLAEIHLRRARRPRQDQPRPLLAQGRHPHRPRQPPRTRCLG